MRQNKNLLFMICLLSVSAVVSACSPSSVDSSSTGTITLPTNTSTATASAMLVTASLTSLNTNEQSTITAYVVDNIGNPVQNANVNFSLDNGLKGRLSNATAATDNNGFASVTFIAGSLTTVATVNGSVGSVNGSAQITITGTGGAINVLSSPASIVVGNTSSITATLRDNTNSPIANAMVSFTLNNTSGSFAGSATATGTTNGSGVVTVTLTGASAGSVIVTAQSLGLTDTATVTIMPVGGVGSLIVTAAPTSLLTNTVSTVTAVLTGPTGTAWAGQTISFSLNNPSVATLSASTAQTNASGIAAVTLTAGSLPATVIVTGSFTSLSSSATVAITTPPPADLTVQPNPASILVLGTSTIMATVSDQNGNPVPDGTVVNFIISDTSLGSLSNSMATTANNNGTATATFIASNKAGSQTVTAIAGGISRSATINVVPAATGSIQFVSANPKVVGIKGSGQPETSVVLFNVKDINGNPVADGTTVTFSMNGPGGGAYITGSVVGAVVATSSTVLGNSQVTLHSGTTAGPVTITATTYVNTDPLVYRTGLTSQIVSEPTTTSIPVSDTTNFPSTGVLRIENELISYTGKTSTSFTGCTRGMVSTLIMSHAGGAFVYGQSPISTQATSISIGGGTPSAGHWNLTTSQFNLAGLKFSGLEAEISGFIADRFGNYNILNGTVINFYAEAGAIDRQGVTDSTGKTSVTFRTQAPDPKDNLDTRATDTDHADFARYYPGTVNEPWRLGRTNNYNPRDGWATILATTMGEEAFLDENGDGIFSTSANTTACPLGYYCECDNGTLGSYYDAVVPGDLVRDCIARFGIGGLKRSEAFSDIGEPFYDTNDNGLRDNGAILGYPYEQLIDANSNGIYDSANGMWDGPGCVTPGCIGSKMIWKDIRLVFSGDYYFWPLPDTNNCYSIAGGCTASYASGSSSFAVAPPQIVVGSSGQFCTIVGDVHLNSLPGNTVISAAASPGTIAAPTSVTLLDGLSTGPTEFCFSVSIDPEETETSTVVTVSVGSSGLPAAITVPLILPPAPPAPTGLSATPLPVGSNTIRLAWNNASGASSYVIYYSTVAGVTKLNGTKITGAASPYDHTSLTPGTTYYYTVASVGIGGEGNLSSEVSGTVPLAPPTGVSAVPGGAAGEIDLSWTASPGAASYNIYWDTAPGVTTSSPNVIPIGGTSYTHTGRTSLTTYYYIVTAVKGSLESTASTEVFVQAP